MAQRLACDVYGTTRNVDRYVVQVHKLLSTDEPFCVMEDKADLSPRAFNRLMGFIHRGISAPGSRTTNEDNDDNNGGEGDD